MFVESSRAWQLFSIWSRLQFDHQSFEALAQALRRGGAGKQSLKAPTPAIKLKFVLKISSFKLYLHRFW
jgi:hypothetical protein